MIFYLLYAIKVVILLNILQLSNCKIDFNSYIKNINSDTTQKLRLKLYKAELRLKESDLEINYIKFRLNKIEKIINLDDNNTTIINNSQLVFYKK
jgi:hypothetical protein